MQRCGWESGTRGRRHGHCFTRPVMQGAGCPWPHGSRERSTRRAGRANLATLPSRHSAALRAAHRRDQHWWCVEALSQAVLHCAVWRVCPKNPRRRPCCGLPPPRIRSRGARGLSNAPACQGSTASTVSAANTAIGHWALSTRPPSPSVSIASTQSRGRSAGRPKHGVGCLTYVR
jgi:hypothetical protein